LSFSKKQILFFGFTIVLLVCTSTVFSLATAQNSSATATPSYSRYNTSLNPDHPKIMAVANNSITSLFGLDTSKYNVTLTGNSLMPPELVPENEGLTIEDVSYKLTSNDGRKIVVTEEFWSTDSIFCRLSYYGNSTEKTATPYYVQPLPTSLSEKTALVLNRYINFRTENNLPSSAIQTSLQTISSISLDGMLNTLNRHKAEIQSTSVIRNNLKVEVQLTHTSNDLSIHVRLIPSYNGLDFPGVTSISFLNKTGDLESFSDSSSLFKVGDTTLNVSKDEAKNTAWNIVTNITSVPIVDVGNVSIQFLNDPLSGFVASVRNNLTAYPLYWFKFPTNGTFYTVDGVEIGIWADNGQVAFSGFTGYEGEVIPNGQILSTATPASTSSASDQAPQANPDVRNTNLVLVIVGVALAASISVTAIAFKKRKHSTS
jgi:hypothetical protein